MSVRPPHGRPVQFIFSTPTGQATRPGISRLRIIWCGRIKLGTSRDRRGRSLLGKRNGSTWTMPMPSLRARGWCTSRRPATTRFMRSIWRPANHDGDSSPRARFVSLLQSTMERSTLPRMTVPYTAWRALPAGAVRRAGRGRPSIYDVRHVVTRRHRRVLLGRGNGNRSVAERFQWYKVRDSAALRSHGRRVAAGVPGHMR